jgi:small subunit ribosomal protein S20
MANIKSAKKRAKQSEKRRVINISRRSSIKTSVKKLLGAIEASDPAEKIKALFNDVQAKLARAKSKKLIHANTASRKISRLAKRVSAKPALTKSVSAKGTSAKRVSAKGTSAKRASAKGASSSKASKK